MNQKKKNSIVKYKISLKKYYQNPRICHFEGTITEFLFKSFKIKNLYHDDRKVIFFYSRLKPLNLRDNYGILIFYLEGILFN